MQTAQDLMRTDYLTFAPDTDVATVWTEMKSKNEYFALVQDNNNNIVAVTDLWNLLFGVSEQIYTNSTIGDIADHEMEPFNNELIVVGPNATKPELTKKMKAVNLIGIPVYDSANDDILGVVTTHDVLDSM